MSKNILIVEDERAIRKFIKINLEREKFNVFEAETGEEAIEIGSQGNIDIVVLDLMLPGIGGYEVCKYLRDKFPELGIIMLTAKSQDMDKIMGLEYGADDYMTKPFNPKELILRIESLIRRMPSKDLNLNEETSFGPFTIKNYSKTFYKDGEEVGLTPTEYKLIELFIQSPGKAFSRDELLNLVWDYDFIGDTKIVDVNIRRLRSKIEEDPSKPKYIETVWGVGYRWKKTE